MSNILVQYHKLIRLQSATSSSNAPTQFDKVTQLDTDEKLTITLT